ncbi:Arm DNA-binding domain-containing protein [Altericroceibacterium spongiae]|uniref:Arm DNA-binding domain-containing protein n=1 Tax=Altericroceibacterium spongiae TaxID=2320269 RepID=UPI003B75CCA3
MALTDVSIRKVIPSAKAYKMGDSLGLFLLVQPSGGKLWRMKYRVDGARGSWASEPIQK